MIKCHTSGTENEIKRERTGWPKSISLMPGKEVLNESIHLSFHYALHWIKLSLSCLYLAPTHINWNSKAAHETAPSFLAVVFTESTYYWIVASSALPVTMSPGSIPWSPGQVAEQGSHSDCRWWCSLKHTSCMHAEYGGCACWCGIQLKAVLFCCDCAVESTQLRLLKSPTGWWDGHGRHSINWGME